MFSIVLIISSGMFPVYNYWMTSLSLILLRRSQNRFADLLYSTSFSFGCLVGYCLANPSLTSFLKSGRKIPDIDFCSLQLYLSFFWINFRSYFVSVGLGYFKSSFVMPSSPGAFLFFIGVIAVASSLSLSSI